MPNTQTPEPAAPQLAMRHDTARSGTANADLNNAVFSVLDSEPADAPAAPAAPAPAAVAPAGAPAGAPAPAPAAAPATPAPAAPSLVPADVLGPRAAPVAPATAASIDNEPTPAAIEKDERANHAWQKVKQERKALRTEVDELKAQLEARNTEIARLSKAQTPDLDEVMALKNLVSEYEAKLGQYDLAATQEFQQRFDVPMQQVLQRGVSVLVRAGKDAAGAKELMTKLASSDMSFEQVQEAIADQPYAIQGALITAVTELGELSKARSDALTAWKDTRAAQQVQSKMQEEIRLMQNVEQETMAALADVVQAGNWMYARSAQDPAWNEQVDARVAAVKGIMRSATPKELAAWVMEGVTAKASREMFLAAHTKAQELQAELQKLVQVTPSLGGGGDPSGRSGAPQGKPRDPREFVNSLLG